MFKPPLSKQLQDLKRFMEVDEHVQYLLVYNVDTGESEKMNAKEVYQNIKF